MTNKTNISVNSDEENKDASSNDPKKSKENSDNTIQDKNISSTNKKKPAINNEKMLSKDKEEIPDSHEISSEADVDTFTDNAERNSKKRLKEIITVFNKNKVIESIITSKHPERVKNAFEELAKNAKKEGYTILIVSSYRTYQDQEDVWKDYKASFGTKKADAYAARAGSSEHETGLAIDVADYNDKNDKFEATESFKWMQTNAHKYGYILRYPKGKENITGYSYEPWHYRYVGIDTATKVYNEGITYDEYYEYYLKK